MTVETYKLDSSDNYLKQTYSRYKHFSKEIRKISLTRAMQYELISQHKFEGDLLDIGGGEKVSYRPWIKCESYSSVNIDPGAEPTWVVSVDDKLPCESESFDTVISFNTLEHIFNAHLVIEEMFRVLRKEGSLIVTTPFLFPIHGHPDDFFRPTPSWYKNALQKVGFNQIRVVPLSWGPMSTGLTCSGAPGPGKMLRKQTALMVDYLFAIWRNKYRPKSETETYFRKIATGFFVYASKV